MSVLPWRKKPAELIGTDGLTEAERNPNRRQQVSAITGDVFDLARELVALLEPFSIEERALARRWADEALALIDRKDSGP